MDDTWLSDATAVDPTFVPDIAGDYVLQLTVDDGTANDSDTVMITAADPQLVLNAVPADVFTQGPSQTEIDATVPEANELPPFPSETSPFLVSPFEVTNCLAAMALNYANSQGYLDPPPKVFPGGNVILNGQILLQIEDIIGEPEFCDIEYDAVHNIFYIARRDGQSMAEHPVVEVSWFGALAFCNWFSEIDGLNPIYDLPTWNFNGMFFDGYHLPFEGEWEYAAAWEDLGMMTGQHHIWGFVSSLLLTDISTQRVNYNNTNPLGLTAPPLTTPVGYYNGSNGTMDSQSPSGCYDMSGNVWEWIFQEFFPYGQFGKGTPLERVIRSGAYDEAAYDCRTARREGETMSSTRADLGFRLFRDLFIPEK